MYEELVGALKKCGYPGDVHYCRDCFLSDSGRTCHMKKLLSAAADAIEELARRNVGKWIPVDEYGVLPDHYETVLLYVESEPEGYITIGSYDYIEMRWKDFCDVNREVYQADVVTHWMPLPEPPKEEH